MSHPTSMLLDTNVWLDAFLPERIPLSSARRLISLAQRQDVSILYPVHIVPDVFYLSFIDVKRLLRGQGADEVVAAAARTTAWEYVNTMRDIATAVGADQADVWLACRQEHLHDDVEDNLVLAAMARSGAEYLVTSDRRLLAHAPLASVAAVTPEDMIRVLEHRA